MGYLHIRNLYAAQEILLFKECHALEKIHGSSAHISWKDNQLFFYAGGEKHTNFVALFNQEKLTEVFTKQFNNIPITIYGEVYGGKMQGMSKTYGKELKFAAFDVRIDHLWLTVPQAVEIVSKFDLEFVDYVTCPTDIERLDAERDRESVQAIRNGMGPGLAREGIVLRPLIEVTLNNGERLIAKHKQEQFQERLKQPKVQDASKKELLVKAEEIAEEFVVPMRLEHILQKLPEAKGIEDTKIVIFAMIEDVYREAEGEIVQGKEVSAAIGKKTAQLWKEHLKRNIGH